MTPEDFVDNSGLPLVQYFMNRVAVRPCCFSCAKQGRENISDDTVSLEKLEVSYDRSTNDSYGPGC